jgi:hypothetical protein
MWTKGNWGRGFVLGHRVFTWNTELGGGPWCGNRLTEMEGSALDVWACVEIAPDGAMAPTPAWSDRQEEWALRMIERSKPDLYLDDDRYWLERITSDVSYA